MLDLRGSTSPNERMGTEAEPLEASVDQPVPTLRSVPRPARALVVGASGGLGAALAAGAAAAGLSTIGTARRARDALRPLDLTDEASIARLADELRPSPVALRLVIVASGILQDAQVQPEKNMRALDSDCLARSFLINSVGPALVAKHILPLLPRDGKSVFAVLSARVGSIEDNRLGGWYGYRASKAALNQIVRTLAIEVGRSRPDAIVVALHPGTTDTRLSAPFRGTVDPARLFAPAVATRHLLNVVDRLMPQDSGGFFAWDGSKIPF